MSFNIEVESGKSVRLLTAGKYCDRDIDITATGGSEDLDTVLNEQEALIAELSAILDKKASGGVSGNSKLAEFIGNTLKDITASDLQGITTIPRYAFYYKENLRSIEIPYSVTTIGERAFQQCNSLMSIIIPSSIKSIARYAFANCLNLKSAIVENGVTSIGDSMFSSCSYLESVIIPESVTSIGSGAFYSCPRLLNVRINRSTPPTLSSTSAFNGVNANCVFSVPTGSLSAYSTATNWATLYGRYTFIEED